MNDINPEITVEAGSDQLLPCAFYTHPPIDHVTWYSGTDDQGVVMEIDVPEPTEDDKYTASLLLEDIQTDMNVTCVAKRMNMNTLESDKYTYSVSTYTININIGIRNTSFIILNHIL